MSLDTFKPGTLDCCVALDPKYFQAQGWREGFELGGFVIFLDFSFGLVADSGGLSRVCVQV